MDFWCFIYSHSNSIVTLIASLLGVFAGAAIEKWSRRGRIILYRKELRLSPLIKDNMGGRRNVFIDYAEHLHISIKLEIFNSSGDKRILRDFWLSNYEEGKSSLSFLRSKKTKPLINFTDTPFLAIEPKEIKTVYLNFDPFEDTSIFYGSDFFLEYKDHKNRQRKEKLEIMDREEYIKK